ncbi:flagellin [Rhodospirillum rubrum]|uniref:Flagellin n=1 Tax=Rhodospirillum rubrum (strain ATCC 11170 / ATH 1.1.1 / DSM 467 / LMG 4362 / NCIMB 8255 / S1) TaxID=269796 RepID=Q2RQE0_RHORT|nr:flagellin [Rhodospirillum rubrum]ABC23655.1 Flagellin-like [Rhodospirillum rubrum ATCC 11170]AEO49393.1 flagellin-like protein [Rhodospirillum rubrum F11]MBK5955331.1 flagellin [Rhodospirillum rubrum]QXG79615.1 flagellin [Rhodospirillum rubrum]HCF19522.1 flagellin [Rhodospirillum rubrum]
MADNITLSSSTRSNLLALTRTTDLIGRTQDRLSTGKAVNSAIDDALSFFKARNLNSRATDLATIKNGISEGIQVLKTATDALENVEDVLKQMKAIAASAKATASADSTTRAKLSSQFNELRSQIDHLTNDANYGGVNLIKSGADTLTVKFSESPSASDRKLVIKGIASNVDGTSGISVSSAQNAAAGWADTTVSVYGGVIDNAINQIDSALTTVRDSAQTFGTNASMLQIREDFTSTLINTLEGGAADLVNADLNKESANMLSLKTRQQLGTISLSIAQQSEQAVLRLF